MVPGSGAASQDLRWAWLETSTFPNAAGDRLRMALLDVARVWRVCALRGKGGERQQVDHGTSVDDLLSTVYPKIRNKQYVLTWVNAGQLLAADHPERLSFRRAVLARSRGVRGCRCAVHLRRL